MPFFGVLGRNQETESGASPFGFCGQETSRSLRIGPPSSYMWIFEASDPVLSPTVPFRAIVPFFCVLRRNHETESGRHRSAFVGKKLRDHSESDHPVVRCELSTPLTLFSVRSFFSRPLYLSSAFWDGTKKPSLGHLHLAFVGKKLRDHSESDRPVVRCEFSRPPTPF